MAVLATLGFAVRKGAATPALAYHLSHRNRRSTGREARPRASFPCRLHDFCRPYEGTSSRLRWRASKSTPRRASPARVVRALLQAKAIQSTKLGRRMGDRGPQRCRSPATYRTATGGALGERRGRRRPPRAGRTTFAACTRALRVGCDGEQRSLPPVLAAPLEWPVLVSR